jgi:biopolymer transport protein ExbB/TolQ
LISDSNDNILRLNIAKKTIPVATMRTTERSSIMTEKNLEVKKSSKTKFIPWLIVGVILSTGPAWGVILTMIGMISAFQNSAQMADAETMANQIQFAVNATALGFLMLPIGVTIIIITLIKLNRAEERNK